MLSERITLQHFAVTNLPNQANTVVNFSGNNEVDGNGVLHGYAGSMNATNYTSGTGTGDLSVEMKTFYEKALLTMAEPNLVHDQFAVKKSIPRNGGKTIEWRKFDKLPKALNPITEGVTPQGNKLKASAVVATVSQYGDYIEQTDLLELTAIDNTIVEATKELASQAGLTLDTVVRNELCTGTNVLYSSKDNGNGTYTKINGRAEFTANCPLTVKDVFRAVAEMKSMNAPRIGDSYVAIIHPKMAYSLMQEAGPSWVDIHKYKNPEAIYRGEIGTIGGVRFVETSEAKVIEPDKLRDGVSRMVLQADASSGATTIYVEGDDYTAGSGLSIPCYIDGVANTITAIAPDTTNHKTALTVSALSANVSKGAIVCGKGAGKDGSAIFCTLIVAQGAYATTDLAGGGLEHIVKQKGYGQDPLNQRSSIGWKATKVAKILHEEYLIRYESTSPDFSLETDAN